MDLLNLILEKHNKLLADGKLLPIEKLNESYRTFQENFGPDTLKSLDGEVLLKTIFNHSNKSSLVYWLEFKNDDELETNRFGGIGGGSAHKFGIYKRKEDGRWIAGSPRDAREIEIDEAINIAREKRDLLVKGAEIISSMPDAAENETYLQLQSDIDSKLANFGSLGWVHKYYHMLFPEKIDDFHSIDWQIFYLIKMQEKPIKPDGRYALAWHYIKLAKLVKMPVSHLTAVLKELFGSPHSYWRVGTTDETQSYWQEMLQNSYVAIGWPELGDLRSLDGLNTKEIKEHLKKEMAAKYPNTPQAIGKAVNQIHMLYRDIKPNDIVIAAEGQRALGIGKVIGEYEYKEGLSFPHCISVKWLKTLDEKLPNPGEGLRTTVYQFKNIDNLLAIERHMEHLLEDVAIIKPTLKTPGNLTGIIAQIESSLNRKKQIILYGPPGTGKTYWAEKACLELASRKNFRKSYEDTDETEKAILVGDSSSKGYVRFCCFHPSYSYEDFIEGIKPSIINDQTVFSLKAGIFKKICDDAGVNSDKNYYLIIDEINRGDISRIFGELITLMEAGKRGKKMTLPLSGDLFSVPENVYIVGTMNTADRSIALLDVALRRRFGFIELMPDYNLLSEITIEDLPLGLWLKELNSRIVEYVGRDARNLQIGHSYFMEKDLPIKGFDKFRKIIQEDVIPLIEEYCYGDYVTIAKIVGSSFVNTAKQEINHDIFKAANKSGFISALLEPKPEIATSASIRSEEEDEDTGLEEDISSGEV
jgi:5-methylcytosine-specific restriction protein B